MPSNGEPLQLLPSSSPLTLSNRPFPFRGTNSCLCLSHLVGTHGRGLVPLSIFVPFSTQDVRDGIVRVYTQNSRFGHPIDQYHLSRQSGIGFVHIAIDCLAFHATLVRIVAGSQIVPICRPRGRTIACRCRWSVVGGRVAATRIFGTSATHIGRRRTTSTTKSRRRGTNHRSYEHSHHDWHDATSYR